MAHPNVHAQSSVKKFGGKPEDYIHLHEWLDETKGWCGDSLHRMFRHHSDGKTVYTRYVGEQHVQEDCYGYVPCAKEWIMNIQNKTKPQWMIRTLKMDHID
jgi:hypothetical protein